LQALSYNVKNLLPVVFKKTKVKHIFEGNGWHSSGSVQQVIIKQFALKETIMFQVAGSQHRLVLWLGG
jgi:hypothetical protein